LSYNCFSRLFGKEFPVRPLPFVEPFYASIFWTAYLLWLAFEGSSSRSRLARDATGARDRGSFRFIQLLLWISLTVGFFLAWFQPQAAIRWNRPAVFFAGIAFLLSGIAFRWYAMALLGRFFTFDVAVHTGQTVVEAGPYRYIRHPSYAGIFMIVAGVGLALGNWISLAVLLGCTGIAFVYRISVEEAALVGALGEPYKQYMRRTRRLIPFLF
jgi:protein-S-isoprenylcysteine O-methyltransferase Ste14